MNKYTPVIGLEIHVELKTNSKMFCGCKNDPFGASQPNIYTCPVCLGLPGALPVVNKKAIEWIVKLGLATGCQINRFSKFDRKNYFYADLAKGYQISQYDVPFCKDGTISTSQGKIRLNRIHMEEDTGKLIHDTVNGKEVSLIDFNRSGVPLVEIVSEPDIINGQQAMEYSQKLRDIMRYLDISDCIMAQGGMRLEANVSLKKPGETDLPNYKVEVKNINSFKFLSQAIDYEIQRHAKLLNQGKTPTQETRGFNPDTGNTFSQRTKEEAADYRYFPEPDIPPIALDKELIGQWRSELPELPEQIVERWVDQYQLEKRYAQQLVEDQKQAQWIEAICQVALKEAIKPNEVIKDLVNKKIDAQVTEQPTKVIEKYQALHQTAEIAQDVIHEIVARVLAANQDAVEKYQQGEKKVIGFLIGQTMSQFEQKVDPKEVKQSLVEALEK